MKNAVRKTSQARIQLEKFMKLPKEHKGRRDLGKKYYRTVVTRINEILSKGPCSWNTILEESLNADPEYLFMILKRLLKQKCLFRYEDDDGRELFSGLEKNISSVQKSRTKENQIHSSYYPSKLEELVADMKKILPNETVLYSQWWYDPCVYKKLFGLVNELLPKRGKPLFLGVPTLGFTFSEISQLFTTIADIDFNVLSSMNRQIFRWNECVEYDVNNEVPKSLKKKFNLVWIDPPWSSRLLALFLLRAVQFASQDAYIAVAFPQVLTRPTTKMETETLIEYLSSIGVVKIKQLTGFTQYSVPPFEKRAYERVGISINSSWRKGDLIILKKTICDDYDLEAALEHIPKERFAWNQCQYGKSRVFFRRVYKRNMEKARISFLPGLKESILPTTSSRKEYLKFANLLTTENHGVRCSNPNEMYVFLKSGNLSDWNLFWQLLDNNNLS